MNTLSPFCFLHVSCNTALQWIKERLSEAGLRPLQTFNLNNVRHLSPDCVCPQHGQTGCDCQMVVLLIYGSASEPVTLILHGNDRQTWLSFVTSSLQNVDPTVRCTIEQALQSQLPQQM